jgi:ribosomal protein L37AE/L43A
MRGSSLASKQDSLVCPLCEASKLHPSSRDSMRCESCGGRLSGPMLETLRSIASLPDALGRHACEECGHPEMRRLPDGIFHCPACGSEVLCLEASSASKPHEHGEMSQADVPVGDTGMPLRSSANSTAATSV